MEAPIDDALSLSERMAEIEGGDCLKNDSERIGTVLARLSGEAVEAFGAAVHRGLV